MKAISLAILATSTLGLANVPVVPKSLSPDGKIHAVMDVDRDPKISPEWKGDSFPQLEITEKDTGQVVTAIKYFGAAGDDARPLREHVRMSWRSDSKAFAITIDDRFHSASKVFALNTDSKFVEVAFPSYETLTGLPVRDNDQSRPRGRSSVKGWDAEGRLIYSICMSPLPFYSGDGPREHKVLLEVTTEKMTPTKKKQAQQDDTSNR